MGADRALSARARDVATVLASRYAKGASVAWPSRERLAADLGVSLRTIAGAIAQLRDRGWIKITTGHAGGTNRYILTMPTDCGKPSLTMQRSALYRAENCTRTVQKTAHKPHQ
jgi:DNA-binding transcriptional MocR family regulator